MREEVIQMVTPTTEDTKRCIRVVLDRIAAVLDDEEVRDAEKLDTIATIVQECGEVANDTAERLEVREGQVEPVTRAVDIVDIVRHAMLALQHLQPMSSVSRTEQQLAYDELASVLDFFGAEVLD
jgi:hypothetical protein